jgi:radical SAM protein with 4Fe4S-binding SPASM domain
MNEECAQCKYKKRCKGGCLTAAVSIPGEDIMILIA